MTPAAARAVLDRLEAEIAHQRAELVRAEALREQLVALLAAASSPAPGDDPSRAT